MSPSQLMASAAFVLLAAAAGVQAGGLLFRRARPEGLSRWLLAAAAALLLGAVLERSLRIRFLAVTNTFESLLFWAGVTALVLLLFRLTTGERFPALAGLGGTVVALALLAVASSPAIPKQALPPVPALQSHWLALHVSLAFVGESFFVVGFVAAVLRLGAREQSHCARLDRLMVRSIAIGYPIFTVGALVFGAVWAQSAWGAYWSWDPKETWALVTWLVYTAFLHSWRIRRLRGRPAAWLAIVGFAFTVFTFFGVNYLLPGLHSYG
jgi:ABC-type transport system involved in cytochrome c biogenesis permease subunit